ncbi:MAG: FAD-dependent oxidoreductase [Sphaerochaetaceae bacterium]|nr:FAD-dependent oxidoreductase [Sphaerochaetaceae bacterium]
MTKKDKQIVIVGAGLAGLTAAAYLSREGYSVLLLEKNENCGGLITSFSHEGFVFDVGARSIENSGVIKPMLRDLGIEMELLKSPVSLGIGSEILSITKMEDLTKYKGLLIKNYPENKKDIDRIFKVIYKISKSMEVIYGFDNPIFKKDFTHDKEYLIHEILPWIGKFIFAVMHMNRMNEPINEFLEKYTSNQSLINIISQHFFKETPTFFALGYFYVYQEYFYPKGGTGTLTQKLANRIVENEGKIQNNTIIQKIDPKRKVVFDNQGKEYKYSKLLWGADLKEYYSILDISQLSQEIKQKTQKQKDKVMASRGGDSVFSLYLGVNKSLEYFSSISNGHFFFTPQNTGLGEINKKELTHILKDFEKLQKKEILEWIDKYCKLNTFEISIPALRDPSLAPQGKSGLIVNLFFEYDLVKKIKDAGWYDEFKKELEKIMIETLNNSIYPELKDNIIFQFSFSPLSYQNKVRTAEGGITGWTYQRPSPAISDLKKIAKSVKTTIPDIYQAGQWAYSPAGIPTAILTGWYAWDAINKILIEK